MRYLAMTVLPSPLTYTTRTHVLPPTPLHPSTHLYTMLASPMMLVSLDAPLKVRGAPYASDSSGQPWLSMQLLRCHVTPVTRHTHKRVNTPPHRL